MEKEKKSLKESDILGRVLCSYYGKSLLQNGKDLYIVKQYLLPGEDVFFNPKEAIKMPSYMFAMAAMQEEDFGETLKFIKNNWFDD